jgi:hypothetical protein
MPDLRLARRDARIAYLATVYHLGRPGAEPDALAGREELGLRAVHEALGDALDATEVVVALSDYQLHRLGEALLGTANELKQIEMAEGRSVVPGFSATLVRLFPEAGPEQPGGALELVTHVIALRRRLDRAIRDAAAAMAEQRARIAEAAAQRRPWWKVWGR